MGSNIQRAIDLFVSSYQTSLLSLDPITLNNVKAYFLERAQMDIHGKEEGAR